jgi:hypothetical protein
MVLIKNVILINKNKQVISSKILKSHLKNFFFFNQVYLFQTQKYLKLRINVH